MADDELTDEVLGSIGADADPRLAETLCSLVSHLHEFVREVRPTPAEWERAIAFLTEVGHTCTDTRQEFILLSDVLGVSMLVEELNAASGHDDAAPTEATVTGPFHVGESPRRELGEDISGGRATRPLVVTGRVTDVSGAPLAGAVVDVWQADDEGYYDVQLAERPDPAGNLRGLFTCDDDGRFWLRTLAPRWYAIPDDGPVGQLLRASDRHPNRPAHIHFIATAAGHDPVTTHVFLSDSPYLDSDVVFGVKRSLIRDVTTVDDPEAAAGYGVANPFPTLAFDLRLRPASGSARHAE